LILPSRLSIWVKTYVARPAVFVAVGGRLIQRTQHSGAVEVDLDGTKFDVAQTGAQTITIYVYDNRKRFVTARSVKVEITLPKEIKGT
jgi:hypothetical protein